eukprot:5577750-Pyramimonas_sp.AAC.1
MCGPGAERSFGVPELASERGRAAVQATQDCFEPSSRRPRGVLDSSRNVPDGPRGLQGASRAVPEDSQDRPEKHNSSHSLRGQMA